MSLWGLFLIGLEKAVLLLSGCNYFLTAFSLFETGVPSVFLRNILSSAANNFFRVVRTAVPTSAPISGGLTIPKK